LTTLKFRVLLACILGLSAAIRLAAQPERPIRVRPEKKEPVTQALEVSPDPPPAIAAEATRLVFHVSPLSNKGLLSQQIRDALRAVDKANGNAKLIKIRAFVAGTGDLRRVQQVVSDELTEKKIPLPAISTIQVGALPLEGAQVVLEAISEDRKPATPGGIVFLAGHPAQDARDSVRMLREAAGAASVARVTCFLHSLEQLAEARAAVAGAFPVAAANFVQLTRLGLRPLAACEGIARSAGGVSGKLIFGGIQMSFHDEESDIRLAFERAGKAIEAAGGSRNALYVNTYLLSPALDEKVRRAREETAAGIPATSLVFEGLPSLDATMAVEIVAAGR
jgi:enamine deaminase RidA (YjgF/YER057c/UK114 family)